MARWSHYILLTHSPATNSLPHSRSVWTVLEAPGPLHTGNTEEFIPTQQRQKSEAIKPGTLGLLTPKLWASWQISHFTQEESE